MGERERGRGAEGEERRNRTSSLLIRPGELQANLRTLLAVRLLPGPAQLAVEAHVVRRLDARSVADFPVGHVGADLDDHACALVAGGAHAEVRHLGDA